MNIVKGDGGHKPAGIGLCKAFVPVWCHLYVMGKKEYPRISTMQMHYFIEVADKGSFTSAANQLYTTQSTLSKTIITIEQALGVTLFIRSHKRLILTDAGRHLYNKWKDILENFDHSIEESRTLQSGYKSMLTIGFLDSHNPEKIAMTYVRQFLEKNPEIHITVHSYPVQEIREQILNGHLDVAYTVMYDVEQLNTDELNYRIIGTCPHNVGMLSSNPLAAKEILEIKDIADSSFVSISPLFTPSYNGMIDDLCAEAGFVPEYVRYTNNANSLPYNLFSSNDIFLCDRNYRGYTKSDFGEVQFRPIAQTSSGIAMIWNRANNKEELKTYLEGICEADGRK